jgi:hypothetical protein
MPPIFAVLRGAPRKRGRAAEGTQKPRRHAGALENHAEKQAQGASSDDGKYSGAFTWRDAPSDCAVTCGTPLTSKAT